ncbi:MAG: hypothetical protein L3J53_02185 [Proteobacteria bacterium]|nr:hypothetical protein [Pseudomonadota bacterium]
MHDVENYEKLPDDVTEHGQFAKLFKIFTSYLEAALIQGFKWGKLKHSFGKGKKKTEVELNLNEQTYLILALRYKELTTSGGGGESDEVPFEIDSYLTEIDTGVIDANYMNTRFDKFLKILDQNNLDNQQQTLDELHKSFASLSQQEQKYANLFIHDLQSGNIKLERDKTFREYITQYQFNAKNSEINKLSQILGLDESKLKNIMNTVVTKANINEYGRFDYLKGTVDKAKAKAYFDRLNGESIPPFKVNLYIHNLLQDFIISGGFDIKETFA